MLPRKLAQYNFQIQALSCTRAGRRIKHISMAGKSTHRQKPLIAQNCTEWLRLYSSMYYRARLTCAKINGRQKIDKKELEYLGNDP